ncbi:hypothetical protein E2C01_090454 [Portunus trituberculatus]|uniref:Uncharacterized protein n=1 Tax=Portunus trituberculatus TaxID=210409 RepID=A0A5B7JBG7_PORTR|nr:hypothetical protein [Portunus trituberculatus]
MVPKHIDIHNITTKGTPCAPPGSHHEFPSRASKGQRNTNLTNTGGRLVDGAGKQVEGETRAAEERPVLGESREFSAVWVFTGASRRGVTGRSRVLETYMAERNDRSVAREWPNDLKRGVMVRFMCMHVKFK